ncbi:MAG: SDR family oxidoreductase [Bryobacteraceae bacterium]
MGNGSAVARLGRKENVVKVLVTGSHGYIGTALVPMLRAGGHDVTGLDTDLYAACDYGTAPVHPPTIHKDIRDIEIADLCGKGFEAVIHLAGLSNDPLGDLDPELTFDINHRASVRLAEIAKACGISRFLYSSSCSTYGASGDGFLDESGTFQPVTPYGVSKALVERDLSPMAGDQFSPVYLRNATVYGYSPRLRFDLVVNNLVAWAYCTGKVRMKSDGKPWRPLVHVRDVAHAFCTLMTQPRELIHNRPFNVGRTAENYRVRDVAQIVADTVPGSEFSFAEDAGPDARNYRVDCTRLEHEVADYSPQWTVASGASELFERYRTHGLKVEDFEGPRWKRVGHIQQLIRQGVVDEKLRPTGGAHGGLGARVPDALAS